jgi:hypothetical protein
MSNSGTTNISLGTTRLIECCFFADLTDPYLCSLTDDFMHCNANIENCPIQERRLEAWEKILDELDEMGRLK